MTRIYHSEKLAEQQVIQLESQAAQHVARVLRKQVNDSLILFDGSGYEYQAVIKSIQRQIVQVHIVSSCAVDRESPVKIHLLQGLCRGEKMDLIIQKAVELGVASITPVLTEFSNVKLSPDRLAKKLVHWQKVIISACEQCGRNIIPVINLPIALTEYLSSFAKLNNELFLVCSTDANKLLNELKLGSYNTVNVLIGPEGGFSPAENTQFEALGWQQVSLGPRILRTETAAIAVLAMLQ